MMRRDPVRAVLSLLPLAITACGGGAGQSTQPDGGKAATDASTPDDAVAAADGPGVRDTAIEDAAEDAGAEGGTDVADAACAVTTDAAVGPGCPTGSLDQCGTPQQCGPVVQAMEVIGAPPTAQGGAIARGLYFLTGVVNYRSQPGYNDTYQFALQITGSSFAEKTYQHGEEESPISGTFATSGTTLTRNLTCPTTGADVNPYTATATSLTIFHDDGSSACFGGTTALEFTLQ